MSGKLLLLESLGGGVPQMITYLSQLRQLGVFSQIAGILLGTFTHMERDNCRPAIQELLARFSGDLPVARTREIGHGPDSRAITIGESLCLDSKKRHA